MNEEFIRRLCEKTSQLNNLTFRKIHNSLQENPRLRSILNPAFPFPKKIRFGLLRGYLVVEYIGPNQPENAYFAVTADFHDNLLDFLDISISHLPYRTIPKGISKLDRFWDLENRVENINFFLGNSIDRLCDYSYKFFHENESAVFEGIPDFKTAENPFYISNSTFFWTDESGNLKVRRVDFLEAWPLENGYWIYPTKPEKLADLILACTLPKYDVELHGKLNQFIELVGDASNSETQLTKFIEKNPEILQLGLGVREINPQILLKWQYPTEKPNLKPDFMPRAISF